MTAYTIFSFTVQVTVVSIQFPCCIFTDGHYLGPGEFPLELLWLVARPYLPVPGKWVMYQNRPSLISSRPMRDSVHNAQFTKRKFVHMITNYKKRWAKIYGAVWRPLIS